MRSVRTPRANVQDKSNTPSPSLSSTTSQWKALLIILTLDVGFVDLVELFRSMDLGGSVSGRGEYERGLDGETGSVGIVRN
jgi:hypothetical protein